MPELYSVQCPSCSAKLKTTAANAGWALSCPKCGASIRVPGPASKADPTADAAPERSIWRGPAVWTSWDTLWVRTAVPCIIVGALAHILPHFGLQFRKLASLGAAAPSAGTGLVVLGVFLLLYVSVFKGRLLRMLLGGAALAVIGLVLLLAVGYCSAHRNRPFPTRPSPVPAGPMGGPGPGLQGPTGPSFMPPPQQHPRIDYASLVERFGAERVARVTFSGYEGVDLAATIRARIATWDKDTKPASWSLSTHGVTAELVLAPVGDLQQLGTLIDMGPVTGADDPDRRLMISVDKSRCVLKK